jgi:DNA-binding beta-propeller fold protein YncE
MYFQWLGESLRYRGKSRTHVVGRAVHDLLQLRPHPQDHPDNTVWLAAIASNQVIRLDPATQQFTIYDVPVGVKNNKNATPYGMAIGGDGNIWVVENANNSSYLLLELNKLQ